MPSSDTAHYTDCLSVWAKKWKGLGKSSSKPRKTGVSCHLQSSRIRHIEDRLVVADTFWFRQTWHLLHRCYLWKRSPLLHLQRQNTQLVEEGHVTTLLCHRIVLLMSTLQKGNRRVESRIILLQGKEHPYHRLRRSRHLRLPLALQLELKEANRRARARNDGTWMTSNGLVQLYITSCGRPCVMAYFFSGGFLSMISRLNK